MFYSQKKYSDKLGTCAQTIASVGCYLTSWCNFLVMLEMGNLNPAQMNKYFISEKLYTNGCNFNSQLVANCFKMIYEKMTKPPKITCIAETNHYAKLGYPQHFFLYDPIKKLRVDPLDYEPNWEVNDYNIVSYRQFVKISPKIETPKVEDIKPVEVPKVEVKPGEIVDYDKASGEIKTAPTFQELSDPKNQAKQMWQDLFSLIINFLKKIWTKQ